MSQHVARGSLLTAILMTGGILLLLSQISFVDDTGVNLSRLLQKQTVLVADCRSGATTSNDPFGGGDNNSTTATTSTDIVTGGPPANNPKEEKECRVKLLSSCRTSRLDQQRSFNETYSTKRWGVHPGSHTLSGGGSTIAGAFDTIMKLESLIDDLAITSIADVPSGDCGWQFSVQGVNWAKAYFGGDIAAQVAVNNAQAFASHLNKAFAFWDLVDCPLPQWSTTCDPTPQHFDLVIVRDAIQHINIKHALRGIRRIVEESGATYLMVTTYPSDDCAQCQQGDIADGGWYGNNFHCPPWNFPEPLTRWNSHDNFINENDHTEVFKIEDLKAVVANWGEDPCGS